MSIFGPLEFGCIISSNGPFTAYVFCQYSFLLNEIGQEHHGKPLYVVSPAPIDGFPIRKIDGHRVIELKTRVSVDGKKVVPDDELIALACKHVPIVIKPHTHRFGANNVSVPNALAATTTSPKDMLADMARKHDEIYRLVKYLGQTFDLEMDSFGMTGSCLITQNISLNDHDIVVYCNHGEAKRIDAKLQSIRSNMEWRAPAFGIDWPHRLRHPDLGIIDLFFSYKTRDDCPLSLDGFQPIEETIRFSVKITSDNVGGYSPSIYGTNCKNFPWLIVLGTAARGLFHPGENISGEGTHVEIKMNNTITYAIMVEFPFRQISNFGMATLR